MTSITPAGALAQRLRDLSAIAGGASKLAASADYLNPPPLDFAGRITTRANVLLRGLDAAKAEQSALSAAQGMGPSSGLHLAAIDARVALNGAADDVRAGLDVLREGTIVHDDVLRDGATILRDGTASASASAHFDAAAGRLALAADGLAVQSMDGAELAARLLG